MSHKGYQPIISWHNVWGVEKADRMELGFFTGHFPLGEGFGAVTVISEPFFLVMLNTELIFFFWVVHWLAEYILEQMLFPKWRSWSWKCKWKWGHGKSWELLECGESKAIYRCSCWQQPQNGSLRNSDGVITGTNNWQGRTDINSSRFGLAVLKNTLGSSALLKINHGLWF